MALSDQEEELLRQLEGTFKEEGSKHRRGGVLGSLSILLGVAALIGGVALPFVPLGILGYVLMFSGVVLLSGTRLYSSARGKITQKASTAALERQAQREKYNRPKGNRYI